MVDELLATRGIIVSYETVRQWALKFGQAFANQIRRGLPCAGDKWHLDEVVVKDRRRHALALALPRQTRCGVLPAPQHRNRRSPPVVTIPTAVRSG